MIDKNSVNESIDIFNALISATNGQIKAKEDFDYAIACINSTYECINALENVIKQMKQESHDITQDLYNTFKNKGYSKNIKF